MRRLNVTEDKFKIWEKKMKRSGIKIVAIIGLPRRSDSYCVIQVFESKIERNRKEVKFDYIFLRDLINTL